MKDFSFLTDQLYGKKSFLCVGLDPDVEKIPKIFLNDPQPLFSFCKTIAEVTESLAIAYKINVAFFESQGPNGWIQLEKLVSCLPKNCLIILDAKRADIGNTSAQYARYFFETLNADAITLHPYMGLDSLQPFLNYKEKWSIILALTSNSGSQDLELQSMSDGKYLFQKVLGLYGTPDSRNQVMFVCGATHPDLFLEIRKICPSHFLLVPGIGAQGGDLHETIRKGRNDSGGLLINVSRSICYPEYQKGFEQDVYDSALSFQQEMMEYF